jgi:hypothetical protein
MVRAWSMTAGEIAGDAALVLVEGFAGGAEFPDRWKRQNGKRHGAAGD